VSYRSTARTSMPALRDGRTGAEAASRSGYIGRALVGAIRKDNAGPLGLNCEVDTGDIRRG
jgi:hypothetical protein